tara:strand:- start:3017 stop:3892 length:876 start_codon:yes stop_codon:yes gene_type:complete
MITFSQLGKMGRLGNQLFQYAALKSLALKKGYECKIPNPSKMEWHGQECLLDNFNIEAEYLDEQDLKKINYRYYEGSMSKIDRNYFFLGDGADILGYFQSYQYFKDFEKQIVKELTPKSSLIEEAQRILENITEDGYEIVSLHVRRGDNQDGTNPQYENFYGEGDILTDDSLYGKYLKDVFEIFKDKNVKYLIFSGGTRTKDGSNLTDIDWCKANIKGENILYSEGLSDMLDFTLMSLCHHNVVCHLSSFGYWAGILNNNPNKIVVAPKDYTLGSDDRVNNGFYPDSWRIL